jgi:LPXTG-motif cell wall-anchored protein
MEAGDTFSHTFSTAGTVTYFCKVHGQSMSGTVVVEGDGPPPTGTPTPTGTLPDTGAAGGTITFLVLGAGLLILGGAGLYLLRRRTV